MSARFSSIVPAGPLWTGVTTWMSAVAMPSARGMESVTSWTTRCPASALPRAVTTTTSCSGECTAASSPPRTAVASFAMTPPSRCRYSVVSSVTGTAPESMMSASTRPGPIDGSCAGSPTSSRRVPSAQASTSAAASSTSSMELSSTTTRSASSGHSSPRANTQLPSRPRAVTRCAGTAAAREPSAPGAARLARARGAREQAVGAVGRPGAGHTPALRAQQPVQRGRGRARELFQPFRGPAGRRGQGHPQAGRGGQ